MNWAKNKLRADIIVSLGSITADGNIIIPYAAATAGRAQRTWMVNNADRVLFGHLKANAVVRRLRHRRCRRTLTATADKMTAAIVTLAKRVARTAHPMIRPIRVNRDEEWFVMFVPSMAYRDLLLDPVIINALQYAWNRGSDNPLFTAGDILYDRSHNKRNPGAFRSTRAPAKQRPGVDVADIGLPVREHRRSALRGRNARRPSPTRATPMASCTALASKEIRGVQKAGIRRGPDR